MDVWCRDHGIAKGALVTMPQLWALSCDWYTDRLDSGWQPRSAAEAERRFREADLTSTFWWLG